MAYVISDDCIVKVTNILSTRICVQNAVLAQMYVLLKQSTKDNRFNRLF